MTQPLWRADVQGLVHITGGGFTENIPRVLPDGLGCKIDTASWQVPGLFRWLQKVCARISRHPCCTLAVQPGSNAGCLTGSNG